MTEPETSAPSVRIGLCLSGGGYRAAAFHLGTMSYLDRCRLLGNLEALSTVSGGTIVGAKFIQSLIDRQPFARFFQDFYAFLRGKSLLERCFEKLGRPSPLVPSRRINAVAALAEAYQEALFNRPDGSPLLLREVVHADIPVKEVCFNATEFRSGLPFRFRRSTNGDAIQGNRLLNIPTTDCEGVRVADIVAASSCFPAGFEPIAFPDDLAWPGGIVPPRLRGQFMNGSSPAPVAIMDGGIGDNQGIDALLEATESWQKIDYLVVSDSDRGEGDLYPYPVRPDYGILGGLSLSTMHWISNAFAAACGLTVLVVAAQVWRRLYTGQYSPFWDLYLYLIPLALALCTFLSMRCIRRMLRDEILANIPGIGLGAWKYLSRLSLRDFLYMVRLRRSSLSVITNSVFMIRIRELIYRVIDNEESVRAKAIKCRITSLLPLADDSRAEPSHCPPTLAESVRIAAAMPTTIWFDDEAQLPSLVICGQATLCRELTLFVKSRYGPDADAYPADVKDLMVCLESDWRAFAADPRFLLNQLIVSSRPELSGLTHS